MTNIRQSFELDALSIMRVRSMPDPQASLFLDCRLRDLERAYRRSFVERGFILLEMEQRRLWRILGYSSLGHWIVTVAPYSRADCYAALAAVKDLHDVPTDQLLEIPRVNVATMRKLSSAVRRLPEVVQAAQTLSAKDFVKQVNASWPEQHLQEASVVDEAIEMAIALEDGCTTKDDVLEMWAIDYMEANRFRYMELKGEYV